VCLIDSSEWQINFTLVFCDWLGLLGL